MTHLPKLLPWIASKNGISEELAAKLWRRAGREIEDLLGVSETSELHKHTLERFLGLVQQESSISNPADFAWVLRHQNHMAFMQLLTAETLSKAAKNYWGNFVNQGASPFAASWGIR